ncbi:hypothetical protein PFISCL1PPCAC_2345, partial [Pristionchus fissidentatus]
MLKSVQKERSRSVLLPLQYLKYSLQAQKDGLVHLIRFQSWRPLILEFESALPMVERISRTHKIRRISFEKMDYLSDSQWKEVCEFLNKICTDEILVHGNNLRLNFSDLLRFLSKNTNLVEAKFY